MDVENAGCGAIGLLDKRMSNQITNELLDQIDEVLSNKDQSNFEDGIELIENILSKPSRKESISLPTKLTPTRKPSLKRRCSVHKYIRFSKRNKTYRTDIYYCTSCPHTITIDRIVGRKCICWECGKVFTVGIGDFPMKPKCNDCRGINKIPREVSEILEKYGG